MFSRVEQNQGSISAPAAILLGLVLAGWCAVPSTIFAQPRGPGDIAEQLARAKAELFAGAQARATDPTANQDCYDALYYRLDLAIDPGTETVSGTVRMEAEVLSGPLGTADLDLYDNLVVDSVACGGTTVGFSHASDLLSITLDRSYATGEVFTVEITYHGMPSASENAFAFDTYGGSPMIWSLSEAFGARTWWPSKDYPEDKADSADIWVTVPDSLIVASNGTLRETLDNGGTKTYRWHEQYPITTYLISVAIHPYTVFSDFYHPSRADSMELRYYVFPDHYDAVQENYAKVPAMIGLFADLFGEYPFLEEKYGHAEFTWGSGGGMEHQTITSLNGYGEYLICHELAHMWWGDMITCETFHHIWLNEGFATYAEALYAEETYGWEDYKQQMEWAKYFGDGTVYVPDLSDWSRVFDFNLSYNKASWVLHMLRGVVGDSTFLEILRTYYGGAHGYGTATTEEFRDVCEQVTGDDFDRFFHEWIYEEGSPHYWYDWSFESQGEEYQISLLIEQLQTNVVFQMPIRVAVTTTAGETTFVAEDSLATQAFALVVGDEPVAVELDPEEWILRRVSSEMAGATFDRGILVVNGVDWGHYGTEITSAYEDSIFWGSLPMSFWDCYGEPAGGYPENLPEPLGHGEVPADTLKQFSSVVWVGDYVYVDYTSWCNTPVVSYLRTGGNLLLMTRWGQAYVYEALRAYLGVKWAEKEGNVTRDASAVYPGLVDMPRIDSQTCTAVFDTALVGAESSLLFVDRTTFTVPRGLGAWREPAEGGTLREDGGQFVFISGRPYRYDHDAMRANCEYILRNFFGEPHGSLSVMDEGSSLRRLHLSQNFPNPFNPSTTIAFHLPASLDVRLRVFDVRGREVATLVDARLEAGSHAVAWNAADKKGRRVSSGVYWCRLEAGGETRSRKMVLLR